ncbi:MAG: HAD family hydrolase [Planctomycetes bacterium]|nr:HAD family hydrolase [Planctomycetota bacterium]
MTGHPVPAPSPLLAQHTPPELVVFDVDGTLHDTFRWWAPILRAGLQRFAAARQMDLALPDDATAEAVVGMKDAGVWAPFLPEGHKDLWPELRATVLPMEVDEVSRGVDYLFAGTRELLLHLRALGVKTALASNCRTTYMRAMQHGQGLAALTDWQFCLDSPGVRHKTDMLAHAQAAAGARRVVMVGDREPDRDAARDLGWPFVWRSNTRCRIDDADLSWGGAANDLLAALRLPLLPH